MENIKLLFQLYFRPAFAMSEFIDRGSWLAAVVIVLVVAGAFFATVSQKLEEAYRIPNFYEYYNPNYPEATTDEATAESVLQWPRKRFRLRSFYTEPQISAPELRLPQPA